MKKTYTGTMLNPTLENAIFNVLMRDTDKKVSFEGVKAWSIIEGGEEAAEIEALGDANSVDENHNYLILHFEDDTEATFRNSHVDLFIW